MDVRLAQMAVNTLASAKFSQVKTEALLDSTGKVKSVQDLDFIVAGLHVPQSEVGHEQMVRGGAQTSA